MTNTMVQSFTSSTENEGSTFTHMSRNVTGIEQPGLGSSLGQLSAYSCEIKGRGCGGRKHAKGEFGTKEAI